MDFRAAVHITVKTGQNILRSAPGLRSEVSNILYPDPRFLHDFPLTGLLERLADFGKPGYEGVGGKASPVLGAQQPVSVADPHNDCRHDFREDHVSAGRAAKRSLSLVLFRGLSAASAEPVLPVPGNQMMRSESGVEPVHGRRPHIAERIHAKELKIPGNRCVFVFRKKVLLVID